MRRRMTVWMILGAGMLLAVAVLVAPVRAQAADTGEATKQADPETVAGQEQVRERLRAQYGATDEQINALRQQQNMGFGEIDHALGIASQMPDGVTDENLQTITDLRSQNMGWGEISKQELGVSLGELKKGKLPVPEAPEALDAKAATVTTGTDTMPEKIHKPGKPMKIKNLSRPNKGRPASPPARGKKK